MRAEPRARPPTATAALGHHTQNRRRADPPPDEVFDRSVTRGGDRQRVVHAPRFPLVSPACGTYTGCGGLYAFDDAGEYRPEWVTCKRCLRLLSQGWVPL